MVSAEDAKRVFGKAFSRPPRLLFTNPVCLMFSLYYAYIYGKPRTRSCLPLTRKASSTSSWFRSFFSSVRPRSTSPASSPTSGLKAQSP